MDTKRRGAFTLIELLIVIAVIGLLAAITLPAVHAARAAARRAHCANNLKQIGLALQNYHSARQKLPPGNSTKTLGACPGGAVLGRDLPSEDRANWAIEILPYLEQLPLYERYVHEKINEAAENRAVRETLLTVFLCPDDGERDLIVPATGPAAAAGLNVAYRPGSYRGVAGRSEGKLFLDAGDFTSFPPKWRGPLHTTGILGFRPESYDDILDGLSNTLLVGEAVDGTAATRRTLWAYSFSFYSLSSLTPQSRILLGDYEQCKTQAGDGYNLPCLRAFGANHPGGVHFLTCDGAVHLLSRAIDMELLARLATIAGHETAQVP